PLVVLWFAGPDASETEWNHTLISDRLPDPAQFVRCYRILHTLWFCEGSHSSRQKVTDITRRTVYLIQSGRKPRVFCRFPGAVETVGRPGVFSRPRHDGRRGRGPVMAADCSPGQPPAKRDGRLTLRV